MNHVDPIEEEWLSFKIKFLSYYITKLDILIDININHVIPIGAE